MTHDDRPTLVDLAANPALAAEVDLDREIAVQDFVTKSIEEKLGRKAKLKKGTA